jgi:biopolymer transport protein ExbB/TolQ
MIDSADTQTDDLFPLPARRGRPSSGTAMTDAERQRRYRQRRSQQVAELQANADAESRLAMLQKDNDNWRELYDRALNDHRQLIEKIQERHKAQIAAYKGQISQLKYKLSNVT